MLTLALKSTLKREDLETIPFEGKVQTSSLKSSWGYIRKFGWEFISLYTSLSITQALFTAPPVDGNLIRLAKCSWSPVLLILKQTRKIGQSNYVP